MDDKIALNSFKNLLNDIDKDNHLFVGTINPEFIKVAISAIESKQELNKKIKYMSKDDFDNFMTDLKRIYNKAHNAESEVEE